MSFRSFRRAAPALRVLALVLAAVMLWQVVAAGLASPVPRAATFTAPLVLDASPGLHWVFVPASPFVIRRQAERTAVEDAVIAVQAALTNLWPLPPLSGREPSTLLDNLHPSSARASVRDAHRAATGLLGRKVGHYSIKAPPLASGPSGGLLFGLFVVEREVGTLTAPGFSVAATGTISADGVVGKVGSVDEKAALVAARDIDLFLVPVEQASSVDSSIPSVRGVGSLTEAVAIICETAPGPGCDSQELRAALSGSGLELSR